MSSSIESVSVENCMFSSDEARVHQALASGMEAYKALYHEARMISRASGSVR